MIDWNDLRFFLAVARAGTTLGAARELGVNQTTCARRIAALEEALGGALFERHHGGYRLIERGEALVEAAEQVEAHVKGFIDTANGLDRHMAGVIRVTTSQPMANSLLAPVMRNFRAVYPQVRVEMMVDDRRLDLARGEADIALRAGVRPTDPCLVARPVAEARWAVYCGRLYAETHGVPTSMADLADHTVVGIEGNNSAWMDDQVPAGLIRYTSNSLGNLPTTLHAGLGVGGLPCMVGDPDPQLVRCFDVDFYSVVWIIYHERLRGIPHVRAFLDLLFAHVSAQKAVMSGRVAEAPA